MADLVVRIARRDDGKYIAASTNSSPYFCFEGESEDEVKRTVDSAISFYSNAKSSLREKRKPESSITITRVRPTSRITKPILEVA